MLTTIRCKQYYTGKKFYILCAQAKIRVFVCNTVYYVKDTAVFVAVYIKWMKNEEYHHGGFQQQNPQRLINEYDTSIWIVEMMARYYSWKPCHWNIVL